MTDDDHLARLHANEDVIDGILAALARRDPADAEILVAAIDPADMADMIRQLCGLVVAVVRRDCRSDEELQAVIAGMIARHAASRSQDTP